MRPNGFQDRRFQPLTHPSAFQFNLPARLSQWRNDARVFRFAARTSFAAADAPCSADCLLGDSGWLLRAGGFSQVLYFLFVELQSGRRDIFFEVRDTGGSGNRQHDRGTREQPCESDLRWRGF